MYITRQTQERYSKWMDCSDVSDAKEEPSKSFAYKPSRLAIGHRIPITLKEFKTYTTKDIKSLLVNNWDLLKEVAKALEKITISTGVSIYVVEEESKKLCRYIKDSISQQFYEIKPGTILAAYSAYTRKLQVSETSTYNPNYPLGIGKDSELQVLSLPVVTPNDKVVAVIDLFRDLNGGKFSEEDQLIGLTVTNWLAAAYEKHYNLQTLKKESDIHQSMFAILTNFFKVNRDIDNLIVSIAMYIKKKMNINNIKFYRIIEDKRHWAYVYEEVKPSKMVRSEKPKRMNQYTGLLSIVLRTRKNLNLHINNLQEKSQHYADALRSESINTILFIPILRSGCVMGIIQLTNKLNGDEFTHEDEKYLENFSKYYSLALHYTNVSIKQKQVELQLQDEKRTLILMLQPCEHDLNEFINERRLIKNKNLPEKFLTFSYYPWLAGEFKLMELSLILLNYSVRDVFENEESMARFVIMSKKIYRKTHYHNFEHAFNVTHCMLNIKNLNEDILNKLEWKALIIASFCHDMDHPGFTNNFLKATSHYLVELYQDSVLENHHLYVAHLLIKELKLFSKFSPEDYKVIMNEIHEAIIATDLAVYFQRNRTITSIITSNSFCWHNPEHMYLLKGVMMTTCDLSAQFKPCNVAVGLTVELYKEFYLQGDKEKALGLQPISMMDRELQAQIPNDQIVFITLICIPCVDILLTFLPKLSPILENVSNLISYWVEQKKQLGFFSNEDEASITRIHEKINNKFKKSY